MTSTTPRGQPDDSLGNDNGCCERSAAHPPAEWVTQRFAEMEGPLVAYTRRRVHGDWDSAREVVQEVFVKLCQQAWPDIEPAATAWLYKTCRNRAIDITRRKGRIPMLQSGNNVSALQDSSQVLPDEQMEHGENLEAMRIEIEQLTEQQQEILRLRLKDGLSYQQIAEVMGLTASNVGYHLHQAVTKLRCRLRSAP